MAKQTPEYVEVENKQTSETIDEGTQVLQNAEVFYERNKKNINIALTAILVVVGGFFAYKYLYSGPREEKAAGKMAYAQEMFMRDSLDKALNGEAGKAGFLKVIREFGGTKSANLAHFYAGVIYIKKGDAKNAIKQLEDFDGEGTLVATAANGVLGNAYVESGNTNKGIDYLKKATSDAKDIVQTPGYLFDLGMAYEKANKPTEAIAAYKRIRDEFPTSRQAQEVDRYIARLGDITTAE